MKFSKEIILDEIIKDNKIEAHARDGRDEAISEGLLGRLWGFVGAEYSMIDAVSLVVDSNNRTLTFIGVAPLSARARRFEFIG